MKDTKSRAKLQGIAARVSRLHTQDWQDVGLIETVLGAVYALQGALYFGYDDSWIIEKADYPTVLSRAAATMARGDFGLSSFSDEYMHLISGHYFNSALLRLSILNEKVDDRGIARDHGRVVRREANRIKHEVTGVLDGRKVRLDEAMRLLEDFVVLLEQIIPSESWLVQEG